MTLRARHAVVSCPLLVGAVWPTAEDVARESSAPESFARFAFESSAGKVTCHTVMKNT